MGCFLRWNGTDSTEAKRPLIWRLSVLRYSGYQWDTRVTEQCPVGKLPAPWLALPQLWLSVQTSLRSILQASPTSQGKGIRAALKTLNSSAQELSTLWHETNTHSGKGFAAAGVIEGWGEFRKAQSWRPLAPDFENSSPAPRFLLSFGLAGFQN